MHAVMLLLRVIEFISLILDLLDSGIVLVMPSLGFVFLTVIYFRQSIFLGSFLPAGALTLFLVPIIYMEKHAYCINMVIL